MRRQPAAVLVGGWRDTPLPVTRTAWALISEDMQHALKNTLVVDEVGEDPVRWLVIGPDRAGNLLELVVLDPPQGPALIHAMRMRSKYRRLLEEEH